MPNYYQLKVCICFPSHLFTERYFSDVSVLHRDTSLFRIVIFLTGSTL